MCVSLLLPVGAQTAGPNGLKLRMEVGLDPGTDIGSVSCHTPLGGYVSKKKKNLTKKKPLSTRRELNLNMTHKTNVRRSR